MLNQSLLVDGAQAKPQGWSTAKKLGGVALGCLALCGAAAGGYGAAIYTGAAAPAVPEARLERAADPELPEDPLERAYAISELYPIIDGHNDLPGRYRGSANNEVWGEDLLSVNPSWDTDIDRIRKGNLGGQFWSVFVSCAKNNADAVRATMEQIDVVHKYIERYPETFALALTADDVEREFARGRVASLIGMEGGHSIDSSLGALRMMHKLGARYMTLTHNCNLPWVDAHNQDPEANGLTDFGREVVREMNRIGMFVDISHVTPKVMNDVLDIAEAPVIFSHSNAFGQYPVSRNVPDDVLRRLPANDGVVMIVFLGGFVADKAPGETRVNMEDVADHIDYIKRFMGTTRHIGLGGDYDGSGADLPNDLEDVSKYPNLIAELYRRGYTDDEVIGIMGGNVLRAMRGMEATAARLQASITPWESVIFPESTCRTNSFMEDTTEV